MADPTTLFHWTSADRLASILEHGLKTGSPNNLTGAGEWSFEAYGCRPIFLSSSPELPYKDHADVLLEVEASELDLAADLPALVDAGAYYDVDQDEMWWKDSDESMSLSKLIRPSPDTDRALAMTGTAACLEDIPPGKIRVASSPRAPFNPSQAGPGR